MQTVSQMQITSKIICLSVSFKCEGEHEQVQFYFETTVPTLFNHFIAFPVVFDYWI